ncbi:nitric oxide synthase [Novosphingobium umbonatum]|uniref:NADPH--hemoprotein reductase n=1 Tax=Novosphingobium umbonatum TaxID=1908524 RepID=A0A437MX58_9SPHN|nr:NADPH cytochrome P450 oxidoreductase family protein [Novosphingobium umbonatum]RVU02251.1 nitric oxide synthase [Novosphingobium umbonatum]
MIATPQGATDWLYAGGLIGGWLALTYACMRDRQGQMGDDADTLVLHASQTGQATDLAEKLHRTIVARGEKCALLPADEATPERLTKAKRLFFIVSTTGDGLAPDNGHGFDRYIGDDRPRLEGKQIAILALGDRRYSQYCAFGQRIAQWAEIGGATFLFPLVEVDDLSANDLQQWQSRLAQLGYDLAEQGAADETLHWRVLERCQVVGPAMKGASGSDGLFRLQLAAEDGASPPWEIGDLFELHTPDGHRRDYSIASLPPERLITLYIRKVVQEGQVGIGSGLLTGTQVGSGRITGRIRPHRTYRTPTGRGPLLAIGAGSGWAGLRPHVLHALQEGQPCRVLFGERASQSETPLFEELRALPLTGLDVALSATQGGGPYVQDRIAAQADTIRQFLGENGRVVLCGRLAMGEACLAALADVMGKAWVEQTMLLGRLRRDLY